MKYCKVCTHWPISCPRKKRLLTHRRSSEDGSAAEATFNVLGHSVSHLVGNFTSMVLFRLQLRLSVFDIISLLRELWSWLYIWHEMGQLAALYDVYLYLLLVFVSEGLNLRGCERIIVIHACFAQHVDFVGFTCVTSTFALNNTLTELIICCLACWFCLFLYVFPSSRYFC